MNILKCVPVPWGSDMLLFPSLGGDYTVVCVCVCVNKENKTYIWRKKMAGDLWNVNVKAG